MSPYSPHPVSRVLGVDPGLTRCGIGVVEGLPGRPPALVAVDVISDPGGDDIAARLLAIEQVIERWLDDTGRTRWRGASVQTSTTCGP